MAQASPLVVLDGHRDSQLFVNLWTLSFDRKDSVAWQSYFLALLKPLVIYQKVTNRVRLLAF